MLPIGLVKRQTLGGASIVTLSVTSESASSTEESESSILEFCSLMVSLLATVGSIWLSVGMNLKACPLCLYQRTFAMGVLAVFGVGWLLGRQHRCVLAVLALPSAL